MGDNPSRSTNATAGGSGVPGRHVRSAGNGVSPRSYEEPPLGGGGALPKKARFSMESGFRGLSLAAGSMVLVIIVAIAVFLISKAVPAIRGRQGELPEHQDVVPERLAAEVRHRFAGLRHGAHRRHRADRRGADRSGYRAVPLALRPEAAGHPAGLRDRPARGRAERGLRPLGPGLFQTRSATSRAGSTTTSTGSRCSAATGRSGSRSCWARWFWRSWCCRSSPRSPARSSSRPRA